MAAGASGASDAGTWEPPDRKTVFGISLIAAAGWIAVGTLLFGASRTGRLLFDYDSAQFTYPFTIQNFTHLVFFIALGELYIRWTIGRRELSFLRRNLLPEDDETVLERSDLGAIRKKVAGLFSLDHGFLPSMINLCVLQFQSGRSVDQTVAVMQGNLELLQHRVDLRYTLIRYLVWFIPTLGFIGTAVGLGLTLGAVAMTGTADIGAIAGQLSVAFDTTIVALFESAITVFLLHVVQEQEELSVNHVGTYTLKNLINRLYVEA